MNALNKKFGITRFWWLPLVTGIICLAFGIWCFINPEESLEVMAYVFTAGICIAGVADIAFGIINSRNDLNWGWGWSLAIGILEIVCGVWLFCLPAPVLTSAFIFAVAIWMIVASINSVCEASYLSRYTGAAGIIWLILALICVVVLSVIFITSPILTGVAAWVWLGLSLIIYGGYRIGLACNLYSVNKASHGMI